MKSDRPKVLHPLAGRSLLGHVLNTLHEADITDIAVVIGPNRDDVAAEIRSLAPKATLHVQTERLGTAHAVLAARGSVGQDYDQVLVLFADTPLIEPATLRAMRTRLAEGNAVVALGFEAEIPMAMAASWLMVTRSLRSASIRTPRRPSGK